MPTLNWIGKQAVVKHHKEVPFRLLETAPDLSCGDSGNLIVQGDNLHALKALLPRVARQRVDYPGLLRPQWRYGWQPERPIL